MIHLNEAYPMPTGAVARARRTSSHTWGACRTIKPAPVRTHVQFDVEPNEDDRVVIEDRRANDAYAAEIMNALTFTL